MKNLANTLEREFTIFDSVRKINEIIHNDEIISKQAAILAVLSSIDDADLLKAIILKLDKTNKDIAIALARYQKNLLAQLIACSAAILETAIFFSFHLGFFASSDAVISANPAILNTLMEGVPSTFLFPLAVGLMWVNFGIDIYRYYSLDKTNINVTELWLEHRTNLFLSGLKTIGVGGAVVAKIVATNYAIGGVLQSIGAATPYMFMALLITLSAHSLIKAGYYYTEAKKHAENSEAYNLHMTKATNNLKNGIILGILAATITILMTYSITNPLALFIAGFWGMLASTAAIKITASHEHESVKTYRAVDSGISNVGLFGKSTHKSNTDDLGEDSPFNPLLVDGGQQLVMN